jgi:hypothetical protein
MLLHAPKIKEQKIIIEENQNSSRYNYMNRGRKVKNN